MEIATYVCSACTTASIASLGFEKDAKSAMKTFCTKVLMPAPNRYASGSEKKWGYSQIEAFYIYTAGPEESGHGHSKVWVKYGTEFTQYIIDNELGPVMSPGPIINYKYHSDTTCQTWLWRPDRDALIKWWEKNMDLEEMEAKLKAKDAIPQPKVDRKEVPKGKLDYYAAPAGKQFFVAGYDYVAPRVWAKKVEYEPVGAIRRPGIGEAHGQKGWGQWDWADGYADLKERCKGPCGSVFNKGDVFFLGAPGPVCEKCAKANGAIAPWER